ncbi:MAG: NAD(P)H-hydrate dehydratase, partial [Kiritimatiellia bacterium]
QPCGGVIVDGLLGTGSEGLPHGVVAAAIHWITRARGRCRVVAIDIPSGLNADTGDSGDPVVRADVTVSLAAPKTGFRNPKAWEWIGHVEIVDIGLPLDLQPEPEAGDGGQFIGAPELAPLLAPRGRGTHKGHYGHVLVIGGSHGLSGAPALAAMGALRSGAGLVSAAVPEICLPWMAALAPSAMAHPIRCERGAMTATTLVAGIRPVSAFDVVVAGPGLSVGEGTARMVEELLRGSSSRLVLDADALNVLDGRVAQLRRTAAAPSVIITPHPGEAARLLGVTSAVIQANRNASAQELAARSQAVVVLKGAGTLVATPAGARHLNLTGNPGMASGGTGDVLAGLIAGLWAQGLSPLDAARLAVYLHGTAGDLGVWPLGERALVADDLGHWLGPACRWLEAMG